MLLPAAADYNFSTQCVFASLLLLTTTYCYVLSHTCYIPLLTIAVRICVSAGSRLRLAERNSRGRRQWAAAGAHFPASCRCNSASGCPRQCLRLWSYPDDDSLRPRHGPSCPSMEQDPALSFAWPTRRTCDNLTLNFILQSALYTWPIRGVL